MSRLRPSAAVLRYVPNRVALLHRLMLTVVALAWLAWIAIGVGLGHMVVALGGRRGRGTVLDFDGWSSLVACGAVVCLVLICVSVIVDHYDQRDNEQYYRRWRKRLGWTAAALLLLAGVVKFESVSSGAVGFSGVIGDEQLRSILRPGAVARWVRALEVQPVEYGATAFVVFLLAALWAKLCAWVGFPPGHRLAQVVIFPALLVSLTLATAVALDYAFAGTPGLQARSMFAASIEPWRGKVALMWCILVLLALIWGCVCLGLTAVVVRFARRRRRFSVKPVAAKPPHPR
jgi:hypothetical protein